MNHVDNPFESPAIVSFCPGILGLERGLERAIGKVRVVAYVEIEAFIIANLVAGMEAGLLDPAPIWTDAKTFDGKPFRGRLHGIIGGYPCQPFSVIGKQTGDQHDHHIWPSIKNAIQSARPFFCFFENVVNHLNIGYNTVKSDLEELGYSVKEGIYSAVEAGATHRRERLFILALADSESLREFTRTSEYREDESSWQQLAGAKQRSNADNSSSNVGNTKSINQRDDRHQSGESERQIGRSGVELDYPECEGLQGLFRNDSATGGRTVKDRPIAKTGFPMGQGYEQHRWEHPRTTQSGLGSTINGYNFREDLLRAIGNSVVEQTAEIAFNDLLRKHLS